MMTMAPGMMVSVPAAASSPNSYPAEEAVLVIVAAMGLAATAVSGASGSDLHAARRAERKKRLKYLAECRQFGYRFAPLAVETSGAFGPAFAARFQEWIGELREAEIAAGGSGWEATWASLHWQQRVAFALHSALAAPTPL